ncbi:MAG: hypothetical protein ACT443_10970, partial [Gemmatimonadota bacterium]
VRIELAYGKTAEFPDTLSATEDVENAGTVRMLRDTVSGGTVAAAAYPLTAWRPGTLELALVNVTINGPEGRQLMSVALPAITVASVLPADTTGIEAKPPKDVLGGSRLWWPWIVAGALALALGAALYWWYRRRKPKQPIEQPIPAILPRDRALEELDRIAAMRLPEQNEFKRFYTLVSEVLRNYMQTVEPTWRTHLTTDEMAAKMRPEDEAKPALALLRQADLVKFARSTPDPATAARDLDRTRAWITSYPAPAPATAPAQGAA